MKAASVKEIKTVLQTLTQEELAAICQRLARFKKENKELLTYLLFESGDEAGYVKSVKADIDEGFAQMNTASLFFVKKTLRKIIRTTARFVRYSEQETTAVELWIYLCGKIRHSGVDWQKSPVIVNMYQSLLKKIKTSLDAMHEDLRYDYQRLLDTL